MNNTIYICQWCQQPLTEIDFNSRYRVRKCDNLECSLHRSPQGYRELSEEEGEAYIKRRKSNMFMAAVARGKKAVTPERAIQNDRRKARKGYQPWLERKKKNYRKLRDLRYSCKVAMANSSDKRMKELV